MTLRAVLVGCGNISKAWMQPASEIDDLKMVGFVDINEEAARARAEQFGDAEALVSTDLDAALAQLKPDIVFDCSIPEAHATVSQTALRSGAHVLVEKPLASSLSDARAMLKTAEESGKLLAVMQNRRYNLYIRRLHQLLHSDQLGPLTALHSDFFIGAHFGGFRDHMPHVLLLDMAIHTFDAARFISGADPVAVYCHEWNPAGSWYDQDSSAIAIFEMSNGVVYSYRGSWSAEGLRTSWESHWRVIGTQGTAIWQDDDQQKAQSVAPGEGLIYPVNEVGFPADIPDEHLGGHGGLIRDFVRCIQTGSTPMTVASDNIKSLAMVFGAVQSAETGQRVEIAQLD